MQALKVVGSLIIILLFAVVILGISLPSDVTINRSVTINAPASDVFVYVNNLQAWATWSPWAEMDPGIYRPENFTGSSGVGQRYCWNSTNESVGSGCMEIIESEPYHLLTTEMAFGDIGEGTSEWIFTENASGQTEVQWTMKADMSKPLIVGPLVGIAIDGFVGDMFETGLQNLKEVSENPGLGSYSNSTP